MFILDDTETAADIFKRCHHSDIFSTAMNDDSISVVIGGDGFFVNTVKSMYKTCKKFIGINSGHYGFLLNSIEVFNSASIDDIIWYTTPLLKSDVCLNDGSCNTYIAFNDVWVRNKNGQASWLAISVDGIIRFDKLVGDGILVCGSQGSTAYASSMGAPPVPVGSDIMVLVGNNVFYPRNWNFALLPGTSTIDISVLDNIKRPVVGYADNIFMGDDIKSLIISQTYEYDIRIGFCKIYDWSNKVSELQFPK